MNTRVSIRPYRSSEDAEAAISLWQASFGKTWPTRYDVFQAVTTGHRHYREGDHFVAECEGSIVGFVATQVHRGDPPSDVGGIAAIVVSPKARHRGIGKALHQRAMVHLRETGMRRARLAGGGARFWPGVPTNLPGVEAFFRACGWEYSGTSYDLVRRLDDYETPPGVHRRMGEQQIDVGVANATDISGILEFEEREFPNWLEVFRSAANAGDHADILVAWTARKGVLGSLVMFTPRSHRPGANVVWKSLLGDDLGGLGAVGVAASDRNRGIGTALVARGSEILRERGVGPSLIDWTCLVDFYGRLGYLKWRAYRMSWRDL